MYLVKLLEGVIINFQAVSAGSTVWVDEETATILEKRNLVEVIENDDSGKKPDKLEKSVVMTEEELSNLKKSSVTVNDKTFDIIKEQESKDNKTEDVITTEDGETFEEVVKGFMELSLQDLKQAAKDVELNTEGFKKKKDYAEALANLEFLEV